MKARSRSDTDIAWAAGFIDGEGSFQYRDSPEISVTNTHLPTLRWLATLFDRGNVKSAHNRAGRPAFKWNVFGNNAIEIIEELLPHLREKREQAALILDIRQLPKPDRAPLLRLLADMKRPSFVLG